MLFCDEPRFLVKNAAMASQAPYPLDGIDRRILRELQADGRITNLKLAEAVHLSPTAVLERVKRLTRDGVILGYEARLNPALLGAGLMVFIEVLLDRTLPDVLNHFRAAVQAPAGNPRMPLGGRRLRLPAEDPCGRHDGLPRAARRQHLDAARRARNAHLRSDGRGEVPHRPAVVTGP